MIFNVVGRVVVVIAVAVVGVDAEWNTRTNITDWIDQKIYRMNINEKNVLMFRRYDCF